MLNSVRFVGKIQNVRATQVKKLTSLFKYAQRGYTSTKEQETDRQECDNDTQHIYDWIGMLNQSKLYKSYPFISPLLLGPIGYYLLDIVAAPIELQVTILMAPIAMDVLHWIIMNRSIKNVNENRCTERLEQFGNRLVFLSRMSWGTALISQSIAFGLAIFNPTSSLMIAGLSIYGTALVTLSPMTPMLFTLINHETVFDKIKMGIDETLQRSEQ